jgi:flagellar motor switch protein FliM
VDRLLGGPAHSVSANRDLSEIETALLDQAVQIILSEWCNQWQKLLDLRPVILSHETHARFLHTAPHDTVMLALAMEASLGDCVEDIQLAFPYYTIEPLVRQVAQSAGPDKEPVAPANGNPRWNRQFNDVPVRVTAGWDGLILSTRELASLKPGDVLTIEPQCFNQIQLRLAGLSRFAGRLGTRDQKWAVEVGQVLKS